MELMQSIRCTTAVVYRVAFDDVVIVDEVAIVDVTIVDVTIVDAVTGQ